MLWKGQFQYPPKMTNFSTPIHTKNSNQKRKKNSHRLTTIFLSLHDVLLFWCNRIKIIINIFADVCIASFTFFFNLTSTFFSKSSFQWDDWEDNKATTWKEVKKNFGNFSLLSVCCGYCEVTWDSITQIYCRSLTYFYFIIIDYSHKLHFMENAIKFIDWLLNNVIYINFCSFTYIVFLWIAKWLISCIHRGINCKGIVSISCGVDFIAVMKTLKVL